VFGLEAYTWLPSRENAIPWLSPGAVANVERSASELVPLPSSSNTTVTLPVLTNRSPLGANAICRA